MKIRSIHIRGFANIDDVKLHNNSSSVFVAPNNYGKSNVLYAISFGVRFICATDEEKRSMMNDVTVKPINKALEGSHFEFEIEGETDFEGTRHIFYYAYSFSWATETTEGKIFTELLKIKQEGDSKFKYRAIINRESADAFHHLPSRTGRCDKKHVAQFNSLALNLLSHNQNLFFSPLLRQLSAITIPYLDTLENPNLYFSADGKTGLSILDGKTIPAYLYKLKKENEDSFELLRSGILQLLPNLEQFEPTETVLGEGLLNKVYDIRIKESQNTQQTSIRMLSSGSKRVIFILTMCITAGIKDIPMILLEEPENSIHPRLLQNLLSCMRGLAENTKIVLTSHSTHIMRYFDPERLYLGLPNEEKLAIFTRLKPEKVKTIYRKANDMDISFGEYMYEMLLDMKYDSEIVKEYFL